MGTRSARLAGAAAGILLAGATIAAGPPAWAASPAAAGSAAAAAAARYTVIDLDTLGAGDFSAASDVNNAGQVVGTFHPDPLHRHGFRWVNGVLTDLGTIAPGADSLANAINDAGQVAGTATRSPGGFGYPVRWSASGAITDLGGPVPNALGEGNGIDPAGQVVGGQRPDGSSGNALATLYRVDNTRVNLGDLGPAQDINARGQVVGGFPAYVWRAGTTTLLPALPGSNGAFANAINVRGDVVGYAFNGNPNGATTSVRWVNGAIQEFGGLGNLTNSANDINAAGQVVGTSTDDCGGCPARAWVAEAGTVSQLVDHVPAGSGWTFESANGINDRGQIVGAGTHNGHPRAFLLTPTFSALVNFQPAGARTPAGYTADTGAVFGLRAGGLSFGWNADNRANTRDRDAAFSPDQRYDTLNHMQKPGGARTWQIAVPNGLYMIHVVSGDPVATDSRFRVVVEGLLAVRGTPSGSQHWFEGTVFTNVTDGRITITNGPDALNNKLNYVDIYTIA
jgi:probable HAF family extracellular repeat protein